MATKNITVKMQIRRDTSINWQTTNPILAAGEIGFDTTKNAIKIGDGSTAWNNLDYTTPIFTLDGTTLNIDTK